MTLRRATSTIAISLALLVPLGGIASADPEWCDSGSPPPNDFRFRPTGGPSAGSSTSWLSSTTGGALDLASGTNTLQGGVANGMRNAIAHARSWYDLPRQRGADGERNGDDDDDDGDHDDDDDDDD